VDRAQALTEAAEFVDKHVATPPTNSRGYTVDGWRAPTAAERWGLIEQVARFLLGDAAAEPGDPF
jgi:hypothetical protein